MSSNRKVKGAIFDTGMRDERYFLSYGGGGTNIRQAAHVYTREEVLKIQLKSPQWAAKTDGKWVLVYE